MDNDITHSVRVTENNPALATLRRSWVTARYSEEDGIGSMGSLHEAGDALVAVAQLSDDGTVILGSGIMIGPGLLITATHVLDEFSRAGPGPAFLTFLPDGARAGLPRGSSTATGPSSFGEDREKISDLTLVSCTLNSDAHEHLPLMLAPLKVALPLVGERLWAFGYRHGALDIDTALVTPFVSSGLVTAAFPHGRGERMPASCIEVEMDTIGGMSGGPVVNADGNLVGIVSSSIEGGPTYVTLIWDALRLRVVSALPSFANLGAIDLFSARALGLVKIHGNIKRRSRGDVVLNMSDAEIDLFVASIDPASLTEATSSTGKFLDDAQLESFEEKWSQDMEGEASAAAVEYLTRLTVTSVREFLAANDIDPGRLTSIQRFSVEDFEGLEDPEIISAQEIEGAMIDVTYSFDLLSVIWTVEISTTDYLAGSADFDEHFLNVEINGATTSMQMIQRCYFEAVLAFDQKTEKFSHVSINLAGVKRPRKRNQTARK